jgi:hypothetical protein
LRLLIKTSSACEMAEELPERKHITEIFSMKFSLECMEFHFHSLFALLENKQTEQVSQREVECYFVDF